MELFKDRRAVALSGMGLALLAGLAIAALLMSRGRDASEPPPASQGGLVVQTGRDDDVKLDEGRPLRCFVNGQLVGDLKLSDCARRNGVASGALDVGLDPTGALAAAHGASSQITPLPPGDSSSDVEPRSPAGASAGTTAEPTAGAPSAGGRVAACWLYADASWSRVPEDLSLSACLRTLYPDRCARGGPPVYGRWADRTLRLLDGRIEISPDNRNFRVLAGRNPDCDGDGPPD